MNENSKKVGNISRKVSGWVNKNSGWLLLLGIIIAVAVLFIVNASKDYLEVERKKCNDMIMGESMVKGYLGDCELYLGSDNKTHYVYHRYYDINDSEGKYFYVNWETGKAGKY